MTATDTKSEKQRRKDQRNGVILAVALIVGALLLFGGNDQPAATTTTPPAETSQVEELAACQHFRNVAGDAASGVLSDTELREKFKEIESSAVGSSVHDEARQLLAGATSGTLTAEDVRAMGTACDAVGH